MRLRTAWLGGCALTVGGGIVSAVSLGALFGATVERTEPFLGLAFAALFGAVAGLVGLTVLLGALQAWIRLRRGP